MTYCIWLGLSGTFFADWRKAGGAWTGVNPLVLNPASLSVLKTIVAGRPTQEEKDVFALVSQGTIVYANLGL